MKHLLHGRSQTRKAERNRKLNDKASSMYFNVVPVSNFDNWHFTTVD